MYFCYHGQIFVPKKYFSKELFENFQTVTFEAEKKLDICSRYFFRGHIYKNGLKNPTSSQFMIPLYEYYPDIFPLKFEVIEYIDTGILNGVLFEYEANRKAEFQAQKISSSSK